MWKKTEAQFQGITAEDSTFDGKRFRAWTRPDGRFTILGRPEVFRLKTPTMRGNLRIVRVERHG